MWIERAFTYGCVATLGLLLGCSQAPPPAADEAAAPTRIDRQVRAARAESPVQKSVETSPARQPDNPIAPDILAGRQPAKDRAAALQSDASGVPGDNTEPARQLTDTSVMPAIAAVIPFGETPDAALSMPRVSLTHGHAQTCRVQVGDKFPNVELPAVGAEKTAGDQKESLEKLLGPRMTLVVFWNGKKATAREQLEDLESNIIARFGAQGLSVVAINSGDDPQLAKELASQAGSHFVTLSDADGSALAQVAPDKVPSSYLLDSAGKVLWFDIEYSRSTRRELVEAVRYTLKQ
jgi:peroxiredoxin